MIFPEYPGTVLKLGSTGNDVLIMQDCIDTIIEKYPFYNNIAGDGIFGNETKMAVESFQALVGLEKDGVIGNKTWNSVLSLANFFSNS